MNHTKHHQTAYVPSTVWLGVPPVFAFPKPAPAKPVKLITTVFKRAKRLESTSACTTKDVANYLEKHGESSATEIKIVLGAATSTICEMLTRLEQKGFVERCRGRVMTRSAGVWFWRSITPYHQPQTQRLAIKEWLHSNQWSTADQIMKATGFGSMSNTMRSLVKLGEVDCELRESRHGKLIKHYALSNGA